MTKMEDDQNGRRPKLKTTKTEDDQKDDQNGRRQKQKTTKIEDDQMEDDQKWKTTKMEDDQNGRRPKSSKYLLLDTLFQIILSALHFTSSHWILWHHNCDHYELLPHTGYYGMYHIVMNSD